MTRAITQMKRAWYYMNYEVSPQLHETRYVLYEKSYLSNKMRTFCGTNDPIFDDDLAIITLYHTP